MNKWIKYTVIFTITAFIVIAGWDMLVIAKGGTEASISYLFRKWSKEIPAMTFGMGFICGHLFWPMRKTPESNKLQEQLDDYKLKLGESNKALRHLKRRAR